MDYDADHNSHLSILTIIVQFLIVQFIIDTSFIVLIRLERLCAGQRGEAVWTYTLTQAADDRPRRF